VAFLFLIQLGCALSSSTSGAPASGDQASGGEGTTRKHPIPLGTQVSIPGWDVKVLEFLRGADALRVINTADWQADPLPQGQEYALTKIFLRCTSLDDNYHSLGISEMFITGSHNVEYGDTMDGWPQPEFLFEDMFTAEAVDGWIDAVIPTDEQNLMVVLNVSKDNTRYTRFFALEDGASISLPAEFANLSPNDLGVKFSSPAPAGQPVISPDWETTVLDSIRGQDAVSILQNDDPNYSPTGSEFEPLLLKVNLRYISSVDLPVSVSWDDFYAVDRSTGYSLVSDRLYLYLSTPSDRVWLGSMLLPGAEQEGWVALNIPAETDQPVIAFNPDVYSSPGTSPNLRYLEIK
jgi:hypothetical protein